MNFWLFMSLWSAAVVVSGATVAALVMGGCL